MQVAVEAERQGRIKAVSAAFTQFMSLSGPFKDWPAQRPGFEETHVNV